LNASAQAGRLSADLASLDPETLHFILSDWQVWARDDQLPAATTPGGADWRVWLILGGRGAGKTRAGAEWVRAKALGIPPLGEEPARRIALVGETLADVRRVMIDGVSGLLAIHGEDERPELEVSKSQLVWPNGAIAQMFSAEDPDSLRGPQFDTAWCDELAKWRRPEETWDMLQFGMRLGENPAIAVTTTPRPLPLLKTIMADPATVITRAATVANAAIRVGIPARAYRRARQKVQFVELKENWPKHKRDGPSSREMPCRALTHYGVQIDCVKSLAYKAIDSRGQPTLLDPSLRAIQVLKFELW
jgi:phage terminase large subunit-like protein